MNMVLRSSKVRRQFLSEAICPESGSLFKWLLMLTNLSLSTTDVLAVGAEGSDEVGGGQESVLVGVHDAKGLLELLDGRVGEGVEDVSFLAHGGVGGGAGGS